MSILLLDSRTFEPIQQIHGSAQKEKTSNVERLYIFKLNPGAPHRPVVEHH